MHQLRDLAYPRVISLENTNFNIISGETKTEIMFESEFKNLCKYGPCRMDKLSDIFRTKKYFGQWG